MLTATGSLLFDFLLTFSLRMRAVWRHDVFRRRVIYTPKERRCHALHATYRQELRRPTSDQRGAAARRVATSRSRDSPTHTV